MIDRNFLLAGHSMLTVKPPASYIAAKTQLGEDWHEEYGYLVERVHLNGPHWPAQYFVKSRTVSKRGNVTYVYLGELDAKTGLVKLTTGSRFPAHATRVKVAKSVLLRIWQNNVAEVEARNWTVTDANESCKWQQPEAKQKLVAEKVI